MPWSQRRVKVVKRWSDVRNKLVQITLGVVLLGILIQVVLIAPKQIRDSAHDANHASGTNSPDVNPSATGQNDIDQTMNGMHMIETQEGAKEWEVWATKAVSFKVKERLELEAVKVVFFSEKGVTFTVTGKKGTVQVKTKNLRVEGDVITRSSNGYVFKTESVDYDSAARRLVAPHEVEMTGPPDDQGKSLKLTGASMRASLKASTMEVERDVHAEKTLEQNRVAYIRSQRALFSGKDKTAQFRGDVILDMDSMRITGPRAQFELDEKGARVKSVLFGGGARVSDADKWATAQNVQVDFEQNRFVFRGGPRVVQNNDELRGEEIVFLDGGKRVQVTGARAKVDEQRMHKGSAEKIN